MAQTRDHDWLESSNFSPDDFDKFDAEEDAEKAESHMTDDQARRLGALCLRAGIPFDAALTRHEADRMIAKLDAKKG